MRLTRLAATGLLSFGPAREGCEAGFSLDLDGTTVVVGPNGAGKSNLVTLLHLVLAVARAYAPPSQGGVYADPETRHDMSVLGENLRHHGFTDGEDAEARAGIELSTPQERELVATFLRAALVSQLTSNNPNGDVEECWSRVDELPEEMFSPLFRGTLVASHSGVAGSDWRLRFEPEPEVDGTSLVWDLSMNMGELRRAGSAVQSQLPDLHTRLGLRSPVRQTAEAQETYLAFDAATFTLSKLVLAPPDKIATVINSQGLRREQMAPVVRRFLDMTRTNVRDGAHTSIGGAYLWSHLLGAGIQVVGTDTALGSRDSHGFADASWRYGAEDLSRPATWSTTDLPRRVWELHNGGPEGHRRLRAICERFEALAGGRKLVVGGSLEPQAAPQPVVPLQLVARGLSMETKGFANQAAPVTAVPAPAQGQQVEAVPRLRVDLQVEVAPGRHLPITAAGSGVAQALVLAEALAAPGGKVTVLDEPACNLHPEWQRFVREQLDAASLREEPGEKAQFLLITHSPFLASPTRLPEGRSALPTRLTLVRGVSAPVPPPSEEEFQKWPVSLRCSAEGWSLLFAAGVLLVEGETEVGALPIWFDKVAKAAGRPPWSARDLAIFSVDGQSGFRSWARFLHHYRVPYALCCDGQALDPWQPVKDQREKDSGAEVKGWASNQHWIFSQLAEATGTELCDEVFAIKPDEDALAVAKDRSEHPSSPTFEEVRKMAARFRVCTLANWFQKAELPRPKGAPASPIESIDDLIAQDCALAQAKAKAGAASKVRAGAEVAARCDAPEAVRRLWCQLMRWLCDDEDEAEAPVAGAHR